VVDCHGNRLCLGGECLRAELQAHHGFPKLEIHRGHLLKQTIV
jgi:hypothetical protein